MAPAVGDDGAEASGGDDQPLLFIQDTSEPEPLGPLGGAMASEGVSFVDNSISTSGTILATLKSFTQKLGPSRTALWNSQCDPLQSTGEVRWVPNGGTSPSDIYSASRYETVPPAWSAFALMTDGEVSESERTALARHAYKTAHLPTVLVIATNHSDDATAVSACNVSVLFGHYSAAQTAVVAVIQPVRGLVTGAVVEDTEPLITVIAAKGGWADSFGGLPDLATDPTLAECAKVTIDQLKGLTAEKFQPHPEGCIMVGRATGSPRWLRLERLLEIQHPSILAEAGIVEGEMEDLIRGFHSQGKLSLIRQWLVDRSQEFAATATAAVAPTAAGTGLRVVLARLRHAQTAEEREMLRQQLFDQAQVKAEGDAAAREQAKHALKSGRRLIDSGLRAAAALEQAGMGADVLGRLSNRAKRAKKLDATELAPMASMDLGGAPEAECHVMLEGGPSAVLLRRVDQELVQENTTDFACDFPLSVGITARNQVFCPDVVGIQDGTADKIEQTQLSLAREETIVALPILSLASPENRRQVHSRLCIAFLDGLDMQCVWQIALSSIEFTLATQEWAGPGTDVGRLLHYMGQQIMQHVTIRKGSRLALEEDRVVSAALTTAMSTRDMVQDYPIEGACTAAAALARWGGPAAVTTDRLVGCITVRAHRAVAQQHLAVLKLRARGGARRMDTARHLWEAVFEVRVRPNGSVVPVAGKHQLPTTWAGLLDPRSIVALDRFATAVGVGANADAMVTPGLALVVRGALAITTEHLSSDAAVNLCRQFHPMVAAELDVNTVGTTTADDAHGVLADWLRWARSPMRPLPPFATPFGPSVLYFYHTRELGASVTNMTDGFAWSIDQPGERESPDRRLTRLVDHIRTTRGLLLQNEFGYSAEGHFLPRTLSYPMYKCMRDVWAGGIEPSDDRFVGAVMAKLLSAQGNVHDEFLEHNIAMLVPSLLAAGIAPLGTACVPGEHSKVSLEDRITAELGDQTTDTIDAEQAPPAIWTQRDDPELRDRLARSAAAIKEALATAAAERKATADVAAAKRAEAAASQPPASLKPRKRPLEGSRLSRTLTRILRHKAEEEGLAVQPDGYVDVQQLLALPAFEGVVIEQLEQAMADCAKQRLHMLTRDGALLIRANQGHSITTVKPERLLTPIADPGECLVCIHGTYLEAWQTIQGSGLNRMSRNNIQMAIGLPGEANVISGIRRSVEVLIYVDVAAAMAAGISFYRSSNGVLCSPGPIPPDCFAHVARRSDGATLLTWNGPPSVVADAAGTAAGGDAAEGASNAT